MLLNNRILHAVDEPAIWSHPKLLHDIIQRNELPYIYKKKTPEEAE
jgi:hypothetical protein